MLKFPTDSKSEAKCNVTQGTMGHLDPKQPPVKRKPYAAILDHDFVQKVEILLPEELYEIIKGSLLTEHLRPTYSRVILPLTAIIEGEFFTEYIKRGNILMLSEGRIGVDNVYTLREGALTLHLDKESYERAGLVGKPDVVTGKRGTRPRWGIVCTLPKQEWLLTESTVVEIDLRQPSMLHGKKGFDRIVYAFKNVLTTPVTWLFCDLAEDSPSPDPLQPHFPTRITADSEALRFTAALPPLTPPAKMHTNHGEEFEDFAVETHEWLSLAALASQRINPTDNVDPYLCRYNPPKPTTTKDLVKIVWKGMDGLRIALQALARTGLGRARTVPF
ncbi:hypothetical protein BP6252_09899 [Coleophoma cylindrospora]|uniref:Uncharacterized protein n=1 Tax=Coleophoma cylindrospora TaxID=1849047 RepID=A0A3D8QXK4_9HELO|nr:hypothetical protein BP6252_09899 [Coleophoma cylindrospora]